MSKWYFRNLTLQQVNSHIINQHGGTGYDYVLDLDLIYLIIDEESLFEHVISLNPLWQLGNEIEAYKDENNRVNYHHGSITWFEI